MNNSKLKNKIEKNIILNLKDKNKNKCNFVDDFNKPINTFIIFGNSDDESLIQRNKKKLLKRKRGKSKNINSNNFINKSISKVSAPPVILEFNDKTDKTKNKKINLKENLENSKEEIENDFKKILMKEIEKKENIKNNELLQLKSESSIVNKKDNCSINNSINISEIFADIPDFEKRKIDNNYVSGKITFNKLIEEYDVRDMILSIEKVKYNNITTKLDNYIQGLLNTSGIENINIMFIGMIFELLRKSGIYIPPSKKNSNEEGSQNKYENSFLNSFSILDIGDNNNA